MSGMINNLNNKHSDDYCELKVTLLKGQKMTNQDTGINKVKKSKKPLSLKGCAAMTKPCDINDSKAKYSIY